MNQVTEITDVEFKEVPSIAPVEFLTEALREAGYHDPEGWKVGLHPAADTAETIGERLFLINRSLCLYLSEVKGKGDTIVPRMFINNVLDYPRWKQVIKEGIVAWLMEQFDLKTGKRIPPPTVFTPGDDKEDDSAIGLNLAATEDTPVDWTQVAKGPEQFPIGVTDDPYKTVRVVQPELSDEQKHIVSKMIREQAIDEAQLTPTLKVRGIYRGAASMIEFQDLVQGEDWHHMAQSSWDLKGITEVIPAALSKILDEAGDTFSSVPVKAGRGVISGMVMMDDKSTYEVDLTENDIALIRFKMTEGGEFNIGVSGGIEVRRIIDLDKPVMQLRKSDTHSWVRFEHPSLQ